MDNVFLHQFFSRKSCLLLLLSSDWAVGHPTEMDAGTNDASFAVPSFEKYTERRVPVNAIIVVQATPCLVSVTTLVLKGLFLLGC